MPVRCVDESDTMRMARASGRWPYAGTGQESKQFTVIAIEAVQRTGGDCR